MPAVELSENVKMAQMLQKRLETSDIQLVKKPAEVSAHRMESDEESDVEQTKQHTDPAIITEDVNNQMVRLFADFCREIV